MQQELIHQLLLKRLTLINLDGDKLDIDKLKNLPTNLNILKSKVDKLVVHKLVPVPVDLSILSDVVKNVVKKDVYKATIKNIEDKIPNITNLPTNAPLNGKTNPIKVEIPHTNNLATTSPLTAAEKNT